MNETRSNSRTKQVKNPIFPESFTEREPLKERENHSLKDSEKTTGYNRKVKSSSKKEIAVLAVSKAEEICKTIEGYDKLNNDEKAITIIFASISILNNAFKYLTKYFK